MSQKRILIVDDNRAIHDDFRKILGRTADEAGLDEMEAELFGGTKKAHAEPYQLDSAYQGQEALQLVEARLKQGEHYALAFVDMRMPPGWDGVQTVENLWRVDPDVQVIICTAYSDYSWEQILERLGANDRLLILKKPFDTAEVCQLALALTEKWQLARRAHLKLSQLKSMVEEQTRELMSSNERLASEVRQRRELEESLRASESRYALAAAAANDGLWDWDVREDRIFYSPRWKAMLGFSGDEISDSPSAWFERVLPEDLGPLQREIDDHLAGQTPQLEREYRIRHRDGQLRWMLCRGLAVREAGQAVRLAGSQSDITDRRMAEEQLRHEALHDGLTGLANRALFTDRLRQCLLRHRRRPDEKFAVLFLDLDRFKMVNDTLGHLAGDQLLVELGKRIVSCVRNTDSVSQPDPGQVARLGGDEFVLLLDGLRGETDALRVAERLIAAVSLPFAISGSEVRVGVSIGIAFGGPAYSNPEELLRDADTALYEAKSNGKGRCEVFSPQMHVSAMTRWRIESELRHAIDSHQLKLVYQPIVDLDGGELLELEALLRWDHPQRGPISPAEFIPVAEETGLILPIGDWVLRESCRQLREWDAIEGMPPMSVAVNVSGKQLAQAGAADSIAAILREAGVTPSRVRLEVTESALFERGAAGAQVLSRMRELQLRLHLDDFGTGYSSLSYLHRMPVEALKIDRSFVSEMGQDPVSDSIVQAIVTLAHAMRIHAIAEGVETWQQEALLRRLGCDFAQGYYYARPMKPADVLAWYRDRALKKAG